MAPPPIPEHWRTDWHLAAHLDQFTDDESLEVSVEGVALRITNSSEGLSARSEARDYPVMVVDDEVFVLMSDAPD